MVRFSGDLSTGLPKVTRRFVTEMIFGIQARGSVRLTEVGVTNVLSAFSSLPSMS